MAKSHVDSMLEALVPAGGDLRLPHRRVAHSRGIATGRLIGFTHAGEALVRVTGQRGTRVARSITGLADRDIDHEVALLFENGDRTRPIVLGVLMKASRVGKDAGSDAAPFELEVDREKIELRAKRQIVIRCGSASVTMTQDGRIIIRGTDVLSRSTGLNRIKGGAVQIN